MDVLFWTFAAAVVAVGTIKALRYIHKHEPRITKERPTTEDEDKTFFDLIRPIWKNPPNE